MRTVTAHQIEHLGWLGLYDKFSKSDFIILCDTMQFKKEYYEHRNKIRTANGWQWLIVNVEDDTHKPMKEIKIANIRNWKRKYLKSITLNYKKSPHFNKYYPTLDKLINTDNQYLIDLNTSLIVQMMKWLGIKKEFCFLSDLNIDPTLKSTERIIAMGKATEADAFLAGSSGIDYLKSEEFVKENMVLNFHQFKHPVYNQQFSPFISNMSTIDYLFNCGGL